MKVIIVNGFPCVGKGEFVSAIIERHPNVSKLSIIDSVKDIAIKMRWKMIKDEKGRQFLSDLKNLCEEFNDSPYQILSDKIRKAEELGREAVFVDARSSRDIDRLKNDFNAITILIKRDVPAQYNNEADANVSNYSYDFEFENNGTIENLKESANLFYDFITEKE